MNKLPLLKFLRTSKVFAIVLGLHLFVLSLLLFHPGCQKTPETPAPAVTTEGAPMGEVSALDNATLVEPTRPEGYSDTTALNDINAGTVVVDPSVISTEVAAPVATSTTYTVVKGDSLWSIAKKNGVTVGALLEANGLNKKSVLKIGQKLQVPAATAPSYSSSQPSYDTTQGTTYKVKAGDNLAKIAKRNGTTVRAIKSANGLNSDMIRVGQSLKIPGNAAEVSPVAAPVEATVAPTTTDSSLAPLDTTSQPTDAQGYTTHKVTKGESPAVIAKKYGMKTAELLSINNISDPRKLKIGQELKVKGASAIVSEPVADTSMSVEALDAATTTTSEATAPVVEVIDTSLETTVPATTLP